ncbi:hypothetical protein [Wenxinia marina]|uniref:Uncharacterized protein n=1 Tax=Wenxinia marina DSM 24838 TaxID=1123501 RepID=A0A0D0NSR2_9RHOB|nr:hypothetical protein [Wenxinia marina]KIQ71210.1 hypothetical protein Wenmar_00589 [Wenxinia marina DSM 24838]GGL81610.1 hypothetical protein GCM10011392_40280 [Wenxinia marina]
MTELLLAIVVVVLSAAGLGLGLALGRGPARSSCGAAACRPETRCDTCPLKRAATATGDER